MEKRPIFILLGLLAAAGAMAEAYTWTDENGVVHYSDRPQPGAKIIELETSSRRRSRSATRPATHPVQPTQAQNQRLRFSYESLEIASPAPEETLWNIAGTLSVSLALTPALQPGHQVRVYSTARHRPCRVRTSSYRKCTAVFTICRRK